MKTCFVSMPFGVRATGDGRTLDFDFLYRRVVRPIVESTGIECRRLDELSPGAIWHKTLLEALISSDLMIADITTDNANVFYELGIRHALRRSRTILISGGGSVPGNISYLNVLRYQPGPKGWLIGSAAEEFGAQLKAAIQRSRRSSVGDSPIYELFPSLDVALLPDLETTPRRRRSSLGAPSMVFDPDDSLFQVRSVLAESEATVRSAAEPDPTDYMALLRRYRDISEWDRLISMAEDAPPTLSQSSEVRQMLALALNRRGQSGDQERAIALMEQVIAETGGDSETFGVLGRIYKDRYEHAKAAGDRQRASVDLERALESYRAGFEKNPGDSYSGLNTINLLLELDDPQARAELEHFVPRVREAVQENLEIDRPDFWVLAADLQLAAVARDWSRARRSAELAMTLAPAGWMVNGVVRDLGVVTRTLDQEADRRELEALLSVLARQGASTGAADD